MFYIKKRKYFKFINRTKFLELVEESNLQETFK